MSIFKCKMCGGDLEIAEGITVAECDYCGTKQTVPKAMDENLQNLFNRANTLRIKSEFDKAEKLYEKIIQADTTQSEAYWGLILCKYGIEYVDDPNTYKKIPTCHRASYDSIIADDDYKSAIENADLSQRAVYEEQAKEIDRIQKEILALAQKEETYDVFICYKETDADGHRTQDSVIANDIYYQLTNEGFKVFYAAITLEGKLGSAYEPIIFAALNSAKVMLSIGTKPEYFNAVWVKNEWSRYLKIIKNDRSKLLIPCYRDMDAYELPEEFAHLQAQDMAKIGFVNDIIRGIKKVIKSDEPKATVIKETVVSETSGNTAPLLKRAFMFLEDGDWNSANEYCEKVLDIDPECAEAYLGKLMVELKIRRREDLRTLKRAIDGYGNYTKALRFADDTLKAELEDIVARIEANISEKIYQEAVDLTEEGSFDEALEKLAYIPNYKNSASLAKECYEKVEKCNHLLNEYKAAFQHENNRKKQKTVISKKITSLNKFFSKLSILKNNWADIESKERALDEQNKKIQEEIHSLNDEKNTLGFFAVKQKREIAKRIDILQKDFQSILQKKGALQSEKNGYKTIQEVESAIEYTIQLIDAKKRAFEELSSIRSSQTIRNELNDFWFGKKLLQQFDETLVGGYIKIGAYEQDNNIFNGKEDIEWLVLEIKKGKALVISKYALDCKPYNASKADVTWETCTLRKWLNNDFINAAFSADEKAMIPTVTVSADNTKYSTIPGNATQDKVFLLSITEVNKYFNSDSARQCKPTNRAFANSTRESDSGKYWWLRSPGSDQRNAAIVRSGGTVFEIGFDVDFSYGAVRPAMWIDLNA